MKIFIDLEGKTKGRFTIATVKAWYESEQEATDRHVESYRAITGDNESIVVGVRHG